MYIKNKIKIILGLAFSSLILIGCGGGSSSIPADPTLPANNGVDGKVADGYLKNAKVCIDRNLNSKCDTGEPYAISTTGGVYNITDGNSTDTTKYPIVVEVIAGVTIDEDDNLTVDGNYTLSAPIGHKDFISPLSTIIRSYMYQNNSMTLAQAKTKFAQTTEVSDVFVLGDYVLANSADATKAHETAQVIARLKNTLRTKIINDNPTDANGNAIGNDSLGGFEALLNEALLDNLASIKSGIAGNNLSAATRAHNIANSITVPDVINKLAKYKENIVIKLNNGGVDITDTVLESTKVEINTDIGYYQNGYDTYKRYTIKDSANKSCTLAIDTSNSVKKTIYAGEPIPLYAIENTTSGTKLGYQTSGNYTLATSTVNNSFTIRMAAMTNDSKIKITATCSVPSGGGSSSSSDLNNTQITLGISGTANAVSTLTHYFPTHPTYTTITNTVNKEELVKDAVAVPGNPKYYASYAYQQNNIFTRVPHSTKWNLEEKINDFSNIHKDNITWSGYILQVKYLSNYATTEYTYKTVATIASNDLNEVSFIDKLECSYSILGEVKCNMLINPITNESADINVTGTHIGSTVPDATNISASFNLSYFYLANGTMWHETVQQASIHYYYVDPATNTAEDDVQFKDAEWFRYRASN